ncbi:RNA-binding protein 47-like [Sitophilus oryzae]|uniref:RNA-binding protein 47-like n=1 Tax=Sitophilus oryzae TaxID=7048 RepID=A0A6J2YPT6_SITOR|nr:RNA-binding protein 47-like [Sitophilus oryzae]
MVQDHGVSNRGFAYVTYMNSTLARKAMKELSSKVFLGTTVLSMELSIDNCRIFIGGLPVHKTKKEIWHQLIELYNVTNIVNVIVYKNYFNSSYNRGFVFLEFGTHEEASHFRAKFQDKLALFGRQVFVDWSIPVQEYDANVLENVKIIFLRGLSVSDASKWKFRQTLYELLDKTNIEKVYTHRDYAFVHFVSKQVAELSLGKLKDFYSGSQVEVMWANPPSKFSHRSFRQKASI